MMEVQTRSFYNLLSTAALHLLHCLCSVCFAATQHNQQALVGNLPYSVGENEIDNFFSQCGGVDDIFLVKDRETGDPKVREESGRLKVKGSLLGRVG